MTAMYTIRRGGAYDRFIMMLEAFLERNCETHCLSLTPIPITNPYFHNHIIHLPLKKVEGSIAKLAVVFLFPFWSFWIAWKKKIDVIIAFGFLYAFLQCLSKWILKRHLVTFIRGSSYFGLKTRSLPRYFLYFIRIVDYLGLLSSDRIVTNNNTSKTEILEKVGKKRNMDVQVLYNNIPPMNLHQPENVLSTRAKYGVPQAAKVLVTAGVLNRGKNIEALIECLPKIGVREVCVVVVGDSLTKPDLAYKNSLIGLARRLGVKDRVIFTGWLEKEDLWKIYLASDLFILPSLSEGMPNALLEALGSDLPCLGSNIPGIKDVLRYDELLFDLPGGNALGDKIRRILSDPKALYQVKELCQERKKEFVFDWKQKIYQVIEEKGLL